MIYGRVIHGRKVGRTLGFPTANVRFEHSPGRGVYAAVVEVGGLRRHGMAFVDGEGLLEVNIFDFDGDLYGREVGVELVEFMRPVREFGSQAELAAQLSDDRDKVKEYFNKPHNADKQ